MAQHYNPIVRTFNQLRTVLVNTLGLDRRLICPEMPLEMLIPSERRQEVWEQLRARQAWSALINTPPHQLITQRWSYIGIERFPRGLRTVGDLVIAATCVREHAHSGYRWRRSEIAFKVRLIVAEFAGIPLHTVREELNFISDLE